MASFTFDGKRIPYKEGDTLASALHRHGVRVLSRSMKYHRPRGLYCNVGSCASCYVGVDGVPNVPACMTAASTGAAVVSQNRVGSAKRDVLGVIDKVYADGFDPHGAFTFPRPLNAAFLASVRMLSGWGTTPEPGSTPEAGPSRRFQRHVDEIVIGAGASGLERALAAADAGSDVLLVEEADELGGSAVWDPSETDTMAKVEAVHEADQVTAWTNAVAFGIYDDTVAVRRGDDLIEVTADRISIAPGRHDAWPLFENNDAPGVLSLRAARRLWYGHGVLPGRRIVSHGALLPRPFLADLERAGAACIDEGQVTAVDGAPVKRVQIHDRWVDADTVICHLPGVPRVELFQQAGCDLGWDNGPAPRRADDGRTSREDVYALFSEAP